MKRFLLPALLASVLFTGWTIQHLGAAHAVTKVESRSVTSADDYDFDAAQRCKNAMPRHWSAMILQK